MDVQAYDQHKVELVLSVHELSTIHQCLNEICHGFVVTDFRRRIGAEVAVVSHILDELDRALSVTDRSETQN
jgi:hypothetical protein